MEGRAKARILVVDDDPKTLRYVRDALSQAGYAPLVTGDASKLVNLIRTETPRVVLLDLMLPGSDGIELMEKVPELADLPVIFISRYGRDETITRAFESGAVDYIVKPFSPTELVARVGATLRSRAGSDPFVLGALVIDYDRRRVTVGGDAVSLTVTEYELLRALSANAGRVVTSESLLRQAWGRRESNDTEPVRAFVKKLRAKLGDDAARPAYIFNVRGVGYRMHKPGRGRDRRRHPVINAESAWRSARVEGSRTMLASDRHPSSTSNVHEHSSGALASRRLRRLRRRILDCNQAQTKWGEAVAGARGFRHRSGSGESHTQHLGSLHGVPEPPAAPRKRRAG